MQLEHSVTIRLGAAHWDVTIHDPELGPQTFNLRAMDRHQRGKFHGLFMSATRKKMRRVSIA